MGLGLRSLRPGHVLIAERDANGIVSLDLNTLAKQPVPASRTGGAFERPTSIATVLTGSGTRLIALCNAVTPTQRELIGLNLGNHDDTAFSLGLVPADAATVATGSAELIVVALPLSGDLAAGGGVEQRRDVVSFNPATATATAEVATPFAPPARANQAWRTSVTRSFVERIRATPEGVQGVFVWDRRQSGLRRDGVLIKATAMDAEFGQLVAQTSVAQRSRTRIRWRCPRSLRFRSPPRTSTATVFSTSSPPTLSSRRSPAA